MAHRSGLREMTIADVPAVYAIEQAVASGPWGEQLFLDCLKVGYACWVLVDDIEVTGYAIVSYAANEAHILQFAIHPNYHRHGLGKKLLQHLLTTAKIHGADEMFLEVRQSNIAAMALYKKYSFVEIGVRKGYYPADIEGNPKEDAIMMALPLW